MKTSKNGSAPRPGWSTIAITKPLVSLDHEFDPKLQTDVFAAVGLPRGLCLGSKSGYRARHRRHYFIPNANVFCCRDGKVWWGDLDLWRHAEQLEQVARRLRCRLYVLYEFDGRFDNAELPFEEARRRAVWHTGGPVYPDRKAVTRSGLSLAQAAVLIGVSVQRLVRRQIPYISQQINRRLGTLEATFEPFARHYGHKKWGHWLLTSNPSLNGLTPIDALRAGQTIVFEKVFSEVYADDDLLAKLAPALIAALWLSDRVSLEWPHVQRRPA